jgi:hypothetical protein
MGNVLKHEANARRYGVRLAHPCHSVAAELALACFTDVLGGGTFKFKRSASFNAGRFAFGGLMLSLDLLLFGVVYFLAAVFVVRVH